MKRIFLIAAGVLGAILLTGSLLLYLNRDRITAYSVDRALAKVEEQVLQRLPDSASAAGARADFARLHERLQSGSVGTEEAKGLAVMFYGSYKEGRIDSLKARQIAGEVHRLAAP